MKKLIACIICLCMVFTQYYVLTTYAEDAINTESGNNQITGDQAVEYYDLVRGLVLSKYKFDIKNEDLYKSTVEYILSEHPELLQEAYIGMLENLDDYSVYYSQEELDSFITSMSGEFCGIGVLVMTVDGGLLVSNVYDNSPAKDAGIVNGDIITHAEGKPLDGLDISVAQSMIVGPENTPVTVTVMRNNSSFDLTMNRRKVVVDSGMYQSIENDSVGYIALSDFDQQAAEFTQKALDEFDTKGIKDIIIDLRNNPGGSLTELVDMCSLFIPSGPAIHLDYKNPFKNVTLYAENDLVKYNVIVLVNSNSASASEAFSAAIQDTGVGIVVGSTTFGKGTMQNITRFVIGGGVKLTEAEYFSPNRRTINGKGVTPDVICEDKTVDYEKAKLSPITYDRVLKIGDNGKDVLALEQRLNYLGFTVGVPDEIYDTKTHDAVTSFQRMSSLYPYGVADITTQVKIEGYLFGQKVVEDSSLAKAIDIFKAGNWTEYRKFYPAEQASVPSN